MPAEIKKQYVVKLGTGLIFYIVEESTGIKNDNSMPEPDAITAPGPCCSGCYALTH